MAAYRKKKIRELLYRSFDMELSSKQKNRLNRALQESEELRREKATIAAQRESLKKSGAVSFSPSFSGKVMERIRESAQKNGIEFFYMSLQAVFRGFAIAGAGLLLILLIYNLYSGGIVSLDDVYYASDITAQEVLDLPLF